MGFLHFIFRVGTFSRGRFSHAIYVPSPVQYLEVLQYLLPFAVCIRVLRAAAIQLPVNCTLGLGALLPPP